MANVPTVFSITPTPQLWSVPDTIAPGPIPFGMCTWFGSSAIAARGSGDTSEVSGTLTPFPGAAMRFTALEFSLYSDNSNVTNFADSAFFWIDSTLAGESDYTRFLELPTANKGSLRSIGTLAYQSTYVARGDQMLSTILKPDPDTTLLKLCDGSGGTTAAATISVFACALLYTAEQVNQFPPNYLVPTI